MNLTSIGDIKNLLARHDFRFSKSLGQNFLTEPSVPEKITAMSGIDKSCGVLEIGPGIGTLTVKLCHAAAKVCAVELDRALLPVLDETLAGISNIKIINGDILKLNLQNIVLSEFDGLKPVACANLPYYITTPAITVLLEAKIFASITIMVQKEVARRICAKPGSSEYGAFSVFVNYYAKPEILFDVPAGCFIPAPKVDSSVLKLIPHEISPVNIYDEALFFKVVRAAFSKRRKTFVNALSSAPDIKTGKSEIISLLKELELPENIRGETFSTDIFAKISNRLSETE